MTETLLLQGREAFRAGLLLNQCPYLQGAKRRQWQAGWRYQQELERPRDKPLKPLDKPDPITIHDLSARDRKKIKISLDYGQVRHWNFK